MHVCSMPNILQRVVWHASFYAETSLLKPSEFHMPTFCGGARHQVPLRSGTASSAGAVDQLVFTCCVHIQLPSPVPAPSRAMADGTCCIGMAVSSLKKDGIARARRKLCNSRSSDLLVGIPRNRELEQQVARDELVAVPRSRPSQ